MFFRTIRRAETAGNRKTENDLSEKTRSHFLPQKNQNLHHLRAAGRDFGRPNFKNHHVMKKIITLCFLVGTMSAFAQTAVQDFYKKYMNHPDLTQVELSGWVLNMAAEFADEDVEKKMLSKITRLRVMVMEKGNLVQKSDYNALIRGVKKEQFEPFMNIREGKETIDLYLRSEADNITNVLVLVSGADQFVLLSLEGNFKFSDLNDLNFKVESGDVFKKIPEDRASIPRA
ncbi:MAG: DUF4252 domain-containing protein [Bacteroidetes bacterium]|nr:MAG: DUF4252 domain-containing protein [Bacteroidota bacterium]